jgi:hypothetical protein
MKCGARVAIGVAGGYFLGRTKKMKLALMLGGLAAGRRTGGPGGLLGQGAKLVGSSPELAALREQLTGRLVEAGKGAVMSVAARQIETLTGRVSDRVESLADPDRLSSVRPRRKGRAAVDEDNDAEADGAVDEERPDEDEDDGADSGAEESERAPARSTSRAKSSSRSSGNSATSARKRTSTRGSSSERAADSNNKTASSERATPKRRTAATRSAGAARSGAKSATTRATRGSRSAR